MKKQRENLTELSVFPFIEATPKYMQITFVLFIIVWKILKKNRVNCIHVFNLSSYGTSYGTKRRDLEPQWSEHQSSVN